MRRPLSFLLPLLSLLPWACGPNAPAPGPGPAEGDAAFRAAAVDRAQTLDPRDVGIGRRVPDLAFVEQDGTTGQLSDYADREAVVIVARQTGCPVCERYGPRLARLEDEYGSRGVAFLFVNPDTYLTAEEVAQERERFGFDVRPRILG